MRHTSCGQRRNKRARSPPRSSIWIAWRCSAAPPPLSVHFFHPSFRFLLLFLSLRHSHLFSFLFFLLLLSFFPLFSVISAVTAGSFGGWRARIARFLRESYFAVWKVSRSHVRAIAHQSTGGFCAETYTYVAPLRSSVYALSLQSRNYKNTIRADQPLLCYATDRTGAARDDIFSDGQIRRPLFAVPA